MFYTLISANLFPNGIAAEYLEHVIWSMYLNTTIITTYYDYHITIVSILQSFKSEICYKKSVCRWLCFVGHSPRGDSQCM